VGNGKEWTQGRSITANKVSKLTFKLDLEKPFANLTPPPNCGSRLKTNARRKLASPKTRSSRTLLRVHPKTAGASSVTRSQRDYILINGQNILFIWASIAR
jgi:hypothetical protein